MTQKKEPRSWTDHEMTTLAEMWCAGRTNEEIAAALNRTPESVSTFGGHFGLPRRVPGGKVGEVDPTARVRKCMCCTKQFFSQGKWNRLCWRCIEEA